MLTLPSKLLFLLAAVAAALGAGLWLAVDDRSGTVLLFMLAAAALAAGVAALGARDVVAGVPTAPAPTGPSTPGAPARATAVPLAGAIAAGVFAVGVAIGGALLYVGAALGVAALIGWAARAWADHPTWTPRYRGRVTDRLVLPVSLPLGMLLLVLVLAASVSRVLLATSKEASAAIAIALAISLLLVFFLIASRPRLSSGALAGIALIGVAAALAAGVAGASAGEREFHPHEKGAPEARITAQNTAFSPTSIRLPANADASIVFQNKDAGIYHNVAIYTSDDANAHPIWNGQGIPGTKKIVYHLKTPAAGRYRFWCDFHVNMRGDFVVQ